MTAAVARAFGYPRVMSSSFRNIVIAAGAAIAAIVAFVAYSVHERRAQKDAIVVVLARGTAALAKSLEGAAGPADVAAADIASRELAGLAAPKQRALQRAADQYLSSARTIVQRRAESGPLLEKATASREALARHLAGIASRDAGWIRQATELQAKARQAQADLERSLNSLAEVLESLPQAQEALAAQVESSRLLPEALRTNAARQAREDAMRSAARLEQARLPGGR